MSHSVDPNASTRVGGDPAARKRPWWVAALLGLLVLGLLLLALAQCGGDDAAGPDTVDQATGDVDADPGAGGGVPADRGDDGQTGVDADPGTGTGVPADSEDEASAGATPSASSSRAAEGASAVSATGGTAGGTLAAGGTDLLANPAALASVSGQQATAGGLIVESVPSDEGFWVGSSPSQRVWVQLSGAGESPFQVVAGQRVSFTGTVTPTPVGFPEEIGVDATEGARQLVQQGQYLAVERASLRLEQQA